MHLQPFHSPLRRAANHVLSSFFAPKPRALRDVENQVLNSKAYVAHLAIPADLTVVGYESPQHGDLIPVLGGFDYYPGKGFRHEGHDTVTLHLFDGNDSWRRQIVLSTQASGVMARA